MLTETYFKIIGDCDIQEVIDILQIQPSNLWKKGDISAKNGKLKHSSTMLQFALIRKENEIYVNRQMLETINVLIAKVDKLKEIKEKFDVEFYLQIVLKFDSQQNQPIISPPREIIEFCYLTQTNIDYDYYI